MDAVAFCHSKGVCHRDLKLDNILLDNNCKVKITDFGHAGIFSEGWDLFSTPLVGSLTHLAPEQLTGQVYSGEKKDMWSLGVILYSLLTCDPPFKAISSQELIRKISTGVYVLPDTSDGTYQSYTNYRFKRTYHSIT